MVSHLLHFQPLRKTCPFLLFSLIFCSTAFSQDKCGSVYYDKLLKEVRSEKENEAEFEAWIRSEISYKRQRSSFSIMSEAEEEEVYKIPVVVHIIHNGESVGQGANIPMSRVLSQIQILNEDFRRLNADTVNTPAKFLGVATDTRIEFVLAKRDPEGFPTNGVVRKEGSQSTYSMRDNWELKSFSYWPAGDYLNIWVAPLRNSLLGFAQFPQSDTEAGLEDASAYELTDGVVIDYQYFGENANADSESKGRTATHEIGHFLGLKHIWGDGGCEVDDYCEDTPLSDGANYNCPTGKVVSCGSEEMFQNYMDYTSDGCMNLFTHNQRERMHAVLQNSPRRASLISSKGDEAPVVVRNDLGIKEILSPVAVSCESLVEPKLVLRNYGNNDILNFKLFFMLNEEVIDSLYQSITLAPLDSIKVAFPTIDLEGAEGFDFKFMVKAVNDTVDGNPDNDSRGLTLVTPGKTVLPVSEDFESGTFGGTLYNPDEFYGWTLTNAPEYDPSNTALMLNCFAYENSTGERDFFYTKVFDLENLESAMLSFSVAYAEYTGGSDDGLQVVISSDCGFSYPEEQILFDESGETLATAKGHSNDFVPTGRLEWKEVQIDLTPYLEMKDLRIAFIGINDYGNNLYIDNIKISGEPNIVQDLLIHDLKVPPVLCGPTFSPEIAIVNKGQTAIASFNIKVAASGEEKLHYSYSGNPLKPSDTILVKLPELEADEDDFFLDFVVQLTEGTTDDFPDNNFRSVRFIVDTTREELPFRENFSEDDSPFKWIIYNPDNSNTWNITDTNASGRDQAIFLNNYDYGAIQEKDWLISPLMNFKDKEFVKLSFNFSYAYNYNYQDKLQVLVSTDCGMSYPHVAFEASGEALSETYSSTSWDPADKATWEEISVSLDDFIGEENVRLAFVMNNGYGNNFYLDDIEFFVSKEPEVQLPPEILYVFPNPVDGALPITFNLQEKETATITLYDMRGKMLYQEVYPNTLNQIYEIDVSSLPASIYLLKISGKSFDEITRLLIAR